MLLPVNAYQDRHSRGAVDHVIVLVKHGYAVRTVETTPKNRIWGCGRPVSLWLWTVAWSRGNGDAPAGACYMMMMMMTADEIVLFQFCFSPFAAV